MLRGPSRAEALAHRHEAQRGQRCAELWQEAPHPCLERVLCGGALGVQVQRDQRVVRCLPAGGSTGRDVSMGTGQLLALATSKIVVEEWSSYA